MEKDSGGNHPVAGLRRKIIVESVEGALVP